jgi:tetratricopeptide (TPR) repeat protein
MMLPCVFRRLSGLALALLTLAAAAPEAGPAGPENTPPRPARNRYQTSGHFGAFLDGRFAMAQGDLDIAAASFLRALEADPRNTELVQPAFIACLLAGRAEAVRLARRLPDVQAAQLLLLNQDFKAGKWEAAEERIRALPRRGVLASLSPLLSAWAAQGAGRTDAALAILAPLTQTHQLRAFHALHAALIADLAGRGPEAARFYRAAQAEVGAGNIRLAQIVASWHARQGRLAEAGQTLRALGEGGEEYPLAVSALLAQATRRPVARAAEGVAEAYLGIAALGGREQQSGDTVAPLLRLAIEIRPDLTPARILLAEQFEITRRYGAGLDILAPIGADDPLAGLARLRRAALLERLERTEEALAELERLARDYPDSPMAQAQVGDILRVKQRFGEAVSAYDKAIARAASGRPENWRLFYARGIAHDRSGNWQKAERDLQRALELQPDHPYVLNYLGYSWADQNRRLPEARALLERAMERKPNDGAITDSMGWVLYRMGDIPGAIRLLERAVELQPEDAVINLHLGDAYWAAGRKREAQFQWRRALLMNPEPGDREKLEAKLREHGEAAELAAPARVQ